MKSVLIFSDITSSKVSLRYAIDDIPSVILIGEARTNTSALQKAYQMEPDYIIIEQSSPLFDGIAFASRLEADKICSRIILLCNKESVNNPVYSQNIIGKLSNDDISPKKLKSIFDSSNNCTPISRCSSALNPTNVPFEHFSIFITVRNPNIGSFTENERREFAGFFINCEHRLDISQQNLCIAFVKHTEKLMINNAIECINNLFDEYSTHTFVIHGISKDAPVVEIINAYSFKNDIKCFFESGNNVTVLPQLTLPKIVNYDTLKKYLVAIEFAVNERDIQDINQLLYEIFEGIVRPSLNFEAYSFALDSLNKIFYCKNITLPCPIILKKLNAGSNIENSLDMAMSTANSLLEATGGQYSSRIRDAIHFMRKNLEKDISADSIAKHIYVSRGYLCQCFKSEVGCTMLEFLLGIRLNRACYLLQMGVLVKDVSVLCGFSDSKYFSKQFKKTIGVTPTQYTDSLVRQKGHRSYESALPFRVPQV